MRKSLKIKSFVMSCGPVPAGYKFLGREAFCENTLTDSKYSLP